MRWMVGNGDARQLRQLALIEAEQRPGGAYLVGGDHVPDINIDGKYDDVSYLTMKIRGHAMHPDGMSVTVIRRCRSACLASSALPILRARLRGRESHDQTAIAAHRRPCRIARCGEARQAPLDREPAADRGGGPGAVHDPGLPTAPISATSPSGRSSRRGRSTPITRRRRRSSRRSAGATRSAWSASCAASS